jgi:hypothetical protein
VAVILAGMTLLQLAQLASAVAATGVSLVTLHNDLKAAGAKPDDELAPEHVAKIAEAMKPVAAASGGRWVDPFSSDPSYQN